MRTPSVAAIKGALFQYQDKPREGTQIRMIYDYFMENRGRVVESPAHMLRDHRHFGTIVNQLNDMYGLDIRRIGQKGRPVERGYVGLWLLAGEWFGKVYVDYVAQRQQNDGEI